MDWLNTSQNSTSYNNYRHVGYAAGSKNISFSMSILYPPSWLSLILDVKSGTSWRGASLLPLPRDLPTHRQFMLVSVPALCILIFLPLYTRVECASPERLPRSLGHMLSVGGQLDRYFLLTCSLSAVGGALPCDSGDELRDPFIPLSCQIAGGSPLARVFPAIQSAVLLFCSVWPNRGQTKSWE